MTARMPLAVHPQVRTRAGMVTETPLDRPAASHRPKANCGFCDQPLFGDVAYCPYCGHRPASAPTDTGAAALLAVEAPAARTLADVVHSYAGKLHLFHAPAAARAGRKGVRWMARWMGIIASAMALALIGIAVQDVAGRNSRKAGPPAASRAPATAAVNAPAPPNRGASATTARAPAAAPVMPGADIAPAQAPPQPVAAPSARNRSLCSAANEAAGLCNPQ